MATKVNIRFQSIDRTKLAYFECTVKKKNGTALPMVTIVVPPSGDACGTLPHGGKDGRIFIQGFNVNGVNVYSTSRRLKKS